MPDSPHFTRSVWFLTLVALLVALGAKVLIGALTPFDWLAWLDNASLPGAVVLIAGETSFWRGDALIRALSFGVGALVACLLAGTPPWRLIVSLLAVSTLSSLVAQFPGPGRPAQLALWAAAAPVATLVVGVLFRALKR
jgi:hypothetical protein